MRKNAVKTALNIVEKTTVRQDIFLRERFLWFGKIFVDKGFQRRKHSEKILFPRNLLGF